MANDPTAIPPTDSRLRLFAALVAGLTLIQAVLGALVLTGMEGDLREVHRWLGYATLVAAVGAAILSVLSLKKTGAKGTMYHAIGLAVLALAQVGLGEAGVRILHAVLGFAILIAAVALWALAGPKTETAPRDPSKPRL